MSLLLSSKDVPRSLWRENNDLFALSRRSHSSIVSLRKNQVIRIKRVVNPDSHGSDKAF